MRAFREIQHERCTWFSFDRNPVTWYDNRKVPSHLNSKGLRRGNSFHTHEFVGGDHAKKLLRQSQHVVSSGARERRESLTKLVSGCLLTTKSRVKLETATNMRQRASWVYLLVRLYFRQGLTIVFPNTLKWGMSGLKTSTTTTTSTILRKTRLRHRFVHIKSNAEKRIVGDACACERNNAFQHAHSYQQGGNPIRKSQITDSGPTKIKIYEKRRK